MEPFELLACGLTVWLMLRYNPIILLAGLLIWGLAFVYFWHSSSWSIFGTHNRPSLFSKRWSWLNVTHFLTTSCDEVLLLRKFSALFSCDKGQIFNVKPVAHLGDQRDHAPYMPTLVKNVISARCILVKIPTFWMFWWIWQFS